MFGLHFKNDFKEPLTEARRVIPETMQQRGEFSFSYMALLLSSTTVCTLGLITNSVAVIIGGMIMAPLMWPLLKSSYALSTRRTSVAAHSLKTLGVSIGSIVAVSTAVAFASPYKQVTEEILSRTAPTTLEIFIALAAGVIAALAVAHPKIGDSIAGVAVATSLLPPLCVTGVGLAYQDMDIALGSFLLFATNVVTIILVATFIFTMFLFGSEFSRLRSRGVIGLVVLLLVISWPLSVQLRSSVVTSRISSESRDTFTERLEEFAPNSQIQEFQAQLSENESRLLVRAVVLLPPDRSLTFDQEQVITKDLEDRLNKDVSLELILQNSLLLVSQDSIEESAERTELQTELERQIEKINPGFRINTVTSELTKDDEWNVLASVRVSDQTVITDQTVTDLEEKMSEFIGRPVEIQLEIIESRVINSTPLQTEASTQ